VKSRLPFDDTEMSAVPAWQPSEISLRRPGIVIRESAAVDIDGLVRGCQLLNVSVSVKEAR
jgi:hypothetical protein